MTKYNGHKNYNAWNVSLWINNDEALYYMALDYIKAFGTKDRAAWEIFQSLKAMNITHTPDGVPYTVTNIRLALIDI